MSHNQTQPTEADKQLMYSTISDVSSKIGNGVLKNIPMDSLYGLLHLYHTRKQREGKGVEGWISVEDGLPEVNMRVVGYRPLADKFGDDVITILKYEGRDTTDLGGIKHGWERNNHVTHWMPLPSIPGTTQPSTLPAAVKKQGSETIRIDMLPFLAGYIQEVIDGVGQKLSFPSLRDVCNTFLEEMKMGKIPPRSAGQSAGPWVPITKDNIPDEDKRFCMRFRTPPAELWSYCSSNRERVIDWFEQRPGMVMEYLDETQPHPVDAGTVPVDFIEYVNNARLDFVTVVKAAERSLTLSTAIDSLLIAYDQMVDKLKPVDAVGDAVNVEGFIKWASDQRYLYHDTKNKWIAAWDNYSETTTTELYNLFKTHVTDINDGDIK